MSNINCPSVILPIDFLSGVAIFALRLKQSRVAQSAEQVTVNHRAVGSSPTSGAKRKAHSNVGFFHLWHLYSHERSDSKLPNKGLILGPPR